MPLWREMEPGDLAGVCAVAEQVHPDLPESPDTFAARIALYPAGSRVLADSRGRIFGYAQAHPIRPFQPPPLDTVPERLPEGARDFYLHDVALLPDLRGGGHAAHAVNWLLEHARQTGCQGAALVSVYGTAGFWSRFGFSVSGQDMGAKLVAYGADAVYMTRPLG